MIFKCKQEDHNLCKPILCNNFECEFRTKIIYIQLSKVFDNTVIVCKGKEVYNELF